MMRHCLYDSSRSISSFLVLMAATFAASTPAAATTTVSSFSPTSGPWGATVTITGSGFTGATTVQFGTSSATFTVVSATQISAQVPTGAASSKITVTSPSGTGTSASSFKVVPSITSVTPNTGPQGTQVVISGTSLAGASAVTFYSNVPAGFTQDPNTLNITTWVPANALTGPITVTVAAGKAMSASSFVVTNTTVSGFTPTEGQLGAAVTISGSGFTGATKVAFDGVSAWFQINSDASVTAIVPNSATSGPISVTAPGGTATSTSSFYVLAPTITSQCAGRCSSAGVWPMNYGPPTSTVFLAGQGFDSGATVDVYFDNTDMVLTSVSGNQFTVAFQTPGSAVPGQHYLTAVERGSGISAQWYYYIQTDWAQFHYGSKHKAVNPYENVLSTSTVSSIDLDWTYATGGPVYGAPAVVNGTVYFGSSDNSVYAVNSSGGLQWKYTTGGSISTSAPAIANGVLYIGSNDKKIYALNANNGTLLWTYTTGGPIDAAPTVANGVVYVGATDGFIYALNASTGALKWSYNTTCSGIIHGVSPAVANGRIYFSTQNACQGVVALNASTGALVWTTDPNTSNFQDSSPAVANGLLYVGDIIGRVYAFNAASGALAWTYQIPSFGQVRSSPAVGNGIVYVVCNDGNLYALNAANGTLLWSYGIGGTPQGDSPAVANGVVYVAGQNALYALNASGGTLLWSYPYSASFLYDAPAVANGTVYIGANDGSLYAFDAAGGLAAVARPNPKDLRPNYSLKPVPSAPRATATEE